jgi:IS605 OrfB family transposase
MDRGQNVPLAAATPDGPVVFWKAARIRHVRRVYAARRKKLQAAGKHRAVKTLERRERRLVTHINHCLSKEVVALAQRCNAGIRLEDLSGIRQRTSQRRTTKADAGQNRDYWPFYQLEHFITYKAHLAGVVVEKVPAAYTSKSCHQCGALGNRKKHAFSCARCHYHAHADANAAQNIRDWYGWCCPLVLEAPGDGPHGMAPNTVRDSAA